MKTSEHPVFNTISRLRDAYLDLGFTEVVNPLFIDKQEVYRQFGPEAPIILDRCFFLAGLPRPDIGLSKEKIDEIEKYGLTLDDALKDTLQEILRMYKTGDLEADDLVEEMSLKLDINDDTATSILDGVFPELKQLQPQPGSMTLRSHMTAGWFLTLAEIADRAPLPVKLFSVDRVFRREQREDASHLRSHHSASCAVMDEKLTSDAGKEVARGLLSYFGFDEIKFERKPVSSRYYAPNSEIEAYVFSEEVEQQSGDGWVEVADFGLYNPASLERYDIKYDVINLGMGVERLTMVLHGEPDIRALMYPHTYGAWEMSDQELSELIGVDMASQTAEGEDIARAIVKICEEKGDHPSPCEFTAWEGQLSGRRVVVSVVEPEPDTKLCGPAYLNEIVVHDGNILGLPRADKWENTFQKGVPTGMRFIDSFAQQAAYEIEEASKQDKNHQIRVRIARSPADINVRMDPAATRYITSNNKNIDIRGPVFTTVISNIEN